MRRRNCCEEFVKDSETRLRSVKLLHYYGERKEREIMRREGGDKGSLGSLAYGKKLDGNVE